MSNLVSLILILVLLLVCCSGNIDEEKRRRKKIYEKVMAEKIWRKQKQEKYELNKKKVE